MKCELCDKGYVRKGRDCVACREICHGNSDTCIDKTGSATGLVTAGRVKCVNCMNNTEGEYCERCKAPLYYHEPLHGQCARCTCNQHSWTCNRDTGLGCTCEDNTISSYIENPTPCSQRNDCHMYQCDECREGYSGDPTNGSLCYQNLRQDTLYSFKGDMSVARPFFVPAVNNEYHWVYIEMVNLSGIIHATTDPKKYDSKLVRLQVHKTRLHKQATYYTGNQLDLRPMQLWITGVERVDYRYSDVVRELNCERRLIKYSPYPSTSGLFLIVRTYAQGGELRIQWYTSKYKYDYYLTTNLIVSALILLIMAYCCMAKLISFGLYLWQQRVRRAALTDNSPKRLVSVQVDISDQYHQLPPLPPPTPRMTSRGLTSVTSPGHVTSSGYCALSSHEPLPHVAPLAIHEFHITGDPVLGDVRAGLCTFLIRLPGQDPQTDLLLGSSLFKTCPKSGDLVREQHDGMFCETAI